MPSLQPLTSITYNLAIEAQMWLKTLKMALYGHRKFLSLITSDL